MNQNSHPPSGGEQPLQEGEEDPPSPWRRFLRARHRYRRRLALRRSVNAALRSLPEVPYSLSLDETERAILHNLILRKDRAVEEHMVPRAEIVALDLNSSRREALETMRECGHSRLPVYQDSLDHVFGFLHVKDLLRKTGGNPLDNNIEGGLQELLRPVIFASPAMRNFNLLRLMRARRTHLALVVDEFGGVDGLITIEDLIEELVGEIEDEHDVDNPQSHWRRLPDGSFLVDGSLRINELPGDIQQAFAADAEAEDIDTLGGFTAWLAGRVPRSGENIQHDSSGWKFIVLQANPRRIIRLRLVASAADGKAGKPHLHETSAESAAPGE